MIPKWGKVLTFTVIISLAALYVGIMQKNKSDSLKEQQEVVLLNHDAVMFTLPDWDKKSYSFENEIKDKFILLNFWATWCEPCKKEIPDMIQLKKRYQDKNFDIVAVDVGEDWNLIKDFFKQFGGRPPFRVVLDKDGSIVQSYGTTKFPESYLIAPGGKIIDKFIGTIPWMEKKQLEYFDRVLNEDS